MPLDEEAVLASVTQDRQVHRPARGHAHRPASAREIAATDHARRRSSGWTARSCACTAPDTPVPYSPPLEEAFLPNVETLLAAARQLARY